MTSSNGEQANTETAAQPPKATKGAHIAPRARRVTPARPRSGRRPPREKGGPKTKRLAPAPAKAAKRPSYLPY